MFVQVATSSLNSRSVVPRLPRVSQLFSASCHVLNEVLDGVTVAKSITLKDKFENLGAR